MSVALRRMRWWDIEAAVSLEQRLFPDDPWTVGMFWSELAGWPATRHYVVAEREDEIVGYAGLSAVVDADVQTLAVAPEAQGLGIGGQLLDDLLCAAATRRAPAVLLEARADNARALDLYERKGFSRLSTRRGYYDGGRVDAVVMRKVLSDA